MRPLMTHRDILFSKTNIFLIFCFLCLFHPLSFADSILTKDGVNRTGTILGASAASVRLEVDTGTVEIPDGDIQTLTFSSADLFRMKDGTTLECKLYGKRRDSMLVVTDAGPVSVLHVSIEEIKYNLGHPLTTPLLPETGPLFSNTGRVELVAGNYRRNLILLGQVSSFHSRDSYEAPCYGFGLGEAFNRNWSAVFSYERFTAPTATFGGSDYRVTSQYFYATLKYGSPFLEDLSTVVYGAIDLGWFSGTKRIQYNNGTIQEGSAITIAARIKGGLEYYIPAVNFSVSSDIGYLYAPLENSALASNAAQPYDLDFRDLIWNFSLHYHIPLETSAK